MNWRSNRIWLTILIACLLALYIPTLFTPKEALKSPDLAWKSLPLHPYMAVIPIPKTDYVDIGLKIGGGLGGLMSLLNLIEKGVKMTRRKHE